jgi:hypothetical protein
MKPLLKLIVPEKAEIVVFISISLLLLLIQNIKRFWVFFDGTSIDTLTQTGGLDTQISNFFTNLEARIDPRIADFLVWVLVGSVVFALFSYVVAALKSASDEAELVHYYKSPKGRAHEINAFITKVAVRLAGIIGIVIWLVIFLKNINPSLTKLFFTSATNLSDPASWLWIVLSIVMFAGSLYVFAILVRVIALKPRIFGSSEEA